MAVDRATSKKVQRLAEDVCKTILAKEALIAAAEGKITIEAFPKGEGYDVKVTVTTR